MATSDAKELGSVPDQASGLLVSQVELAAHGLGARGPMATEPPWVQHPHDLAFEWRRLFSEFFGTFLLVLVAAGAPVVDVAHPGQVPLDAQVVAPGLMVMGIIYFMGMVSGAHLNPAVSISFATRGNFPWKRVPGYILAQLIGAVTAALVLLMLFGNIAHLGATLPSPGTDLWKATFVELLLTLGLVSVILGTASGAHNVGANAAIAIGGYIALAGLWAAPVTGASMNPVRSFAPQLVSGDWYGWWVYLVGPIAGGLLAVAVAWVLRGPPSKAANLAAQGSLEGSSDKSGQDPT